MFHCSPCVGIRRYTHEFMRQLRFCPAACVRPQRLTLIPGVTDNIPGSAHMQYKKNKQTEGPV